jgi:hypothetical protein
MKPDNPMCRFDPRKLAHFEERAASYQSYLASKSSI